MLHDVLHGMYYFVCNHGNHRNAKQDAARVKFPHKIQHIQNGHPGRVLFGPKENESVLLVTAYKIETPISVTFNEYQ